MTIASEMKRGECGSSVLELALVAPLLLLMLVAAVDFGKAWRGNIEVASAAEAGALYGAQNPKDSAGMAAAALLDGANVEGLRVVVAAGCECADGSSAVVGCSSTPSCAGNVVTYADVRTSATYRPMLNYPGIASAFVLSGHSRARSAP